MRCVNKNHPDVAVLAEQIGYNTAITADLIATWQDANGTDTFPTYNELTNSNKEEIVKDVIDRNKFETLLSNIGVDLKFVNPIYLNGESLNGSFNTLSKVVEISIDADKSVIEEETAHAFVEFLETTNPLLFDSMYSDITKYKLYDEVRERYRDFYKGNTHDIKKEAIAKAIAYYLGGQEVPLAFKESVATEDNLLLRIGNWFKKVRNLFKNNLAKFGITTLGEYNDYFDITAKNILAGNFKGTNWQTTNEVTYANLNTYPDKVRKILTKLKEDSENITTQEVEEIDVNGKATIAEKYFDKRTGKIIGRRVSDIIKAKKSNRDFQFTEEQQENFLASAVWGTKVHNDLRAILAGDKNHVFQTIGFKDQLEQLVKNIKKGYHKDTIYVTEQVVYDPKEDKAGTIDLLAFEPVKFDESGNATDYITHVLDYKLIEGLSNMTSEQIENRKKDYAVQLGQYIGMLQNVYKVEKIGQSRMIPLAAIYDGRGSNKGIESIQIGNNKLQPDETSYLDPLPLESEQTSNENINAVLSFLRGQLTRERSNERRKIIKQTIAKLQISEDIKQLELMAEADRFRMQNLISKSDRDKLTNDELLELHHLSDFYNGAINNGYTTEDNDDEISTTSFYAQQNFKKIESLIKTHAFETVIDGNVVDTVVIDTETPIKPTSFFSRFKQLSQYDIPVFRQFYKMLQGIHYNIDAKVKEQEIKVAEILKQIKEEETGNGEDIYSKIINKQTGNLIAKFSPKWYADIKDTTKDMSAYFTKVVDGHTYKEFEDQKMKEWLDKNLIYKDNPTKQKQQRLFYKKTYGMGNPYSKFYDFDTKIFSESGYMNENYRLFVKDKNTGLAKLYRLYEEINAVARKSAEYNVPSGYLPFITKSNIQQGLELGLNNMIPNLKDSVSLHEWTNFTLDEKGKPVYKVPLKYYVKGKKDANIQSYDLANNLVEWTQAVYMNRFLEEAEGSAKLLEYTLSRSKQIVMKNGKVVKNDSGRIETTDISDSTMEKFKEYVEAEIYGVHERTEQIGIFGSNVSLNKVVKKALQYTSGVALVGNILSPIANLTGGFGNMLSVGAKGNHFTNKQVGNAVTLFASGDAKVRAFMKYMDVQNNTYEVDAHKKLTVNKLANFLTWDKLFLPQYLGDVGMQNTTLLAMAQNYTVKDGSIVKKNKDDKSLLELTTIDKDGKLEFPVSNFEMYKFRDKVKMINAEVIGTTSEYNKSLIGNTLYGAMLLQFRRWMLPLGTTRFGDLDYNSSTDEYQIGKYRATTQLLFDKKFFGLIKDIIRKNNEGILDSKLQELYNDAVAINPDLTYEQFKKLHIESIRSTAAELAIFGAVTALIYALAGFDDEDEDKGFFGNLASKALGRTANELSFWYNPMSFTQIVKSPIPMINNLTSVLGLFGAGISLPFHYLLGDEEDADKAAESLGKKASSLTLGLSGYNNLIKLINPND